MGDRLTLSVLTCFGLGRSPFAPGTVGSLPPPLLALALVAALGPHWGVTAGVVLVGVAAAVLCVRFGARGEALLGGKDPGAIVLDEVAGQSMPLVFLPWVSFESPGGITRNVVLALTAFVTFRLFDITKPPPARGLQSVRGGLGILVDDLVAGAYAAAATWLVVIALGW